MAFQSLGYRVPAPDRVRLRQPTLLCRGEEQTDVSAATDWDYSASIGFLLPLTVDLPALLADCGLRPTSEVVAQMTWSSSTTPVRGRGAVVPLVDGVNVATMHAEGAELGGTLTIETRVAVRRPHAAGDFAPTRAGSLLWSVRHTVVLEGAGARFPTTAVSFSDAGLPAGAAWSLDLNTDDLDGSSSQQMQLWLNPDNPGIAAVIAGGMDAGTARVQEMINHDVTRRLVMAALDETDLTDDLTFLPGSVGEALQRLCRVLFPDHSLSALRGQRSSDAGYVDALLQDRLHLFTTMADR